MNTRQLQYAVMLSRVRSFSQVAEELQITQPALSKQIISLESELGVRLFDRSSSPVTLTQAGQHFIREAEQLLSREDQLVRSMEAFRTGESGQLVIGVSPFRSLYLMPPVVKAVRERYPGITTVLREAGSEQLRRDAAEGKYDFAVVNLPVDEAVFSVSPMENDMMVLLVPKVMLPLIGRPEAGDEETLPEIDFSECRSLPFVVVSRGQDMQHLQEMRQLFDRLCVMTGVTPPVSAEVVSVATARAMAQYGVGATLVPYQFIRDDRIRGDTVVFRLKQDVFVRRPAIITRRGQYISSAAAWALDVLLNL